MTKLAIPAFLLMALMASTASAAHPHTDSAPPTVCDLTQLDCWGPNKKCNIKFRNETGEGSGSGGGTGLKQISEVSTIKVSARKEDNTRAGSNTLSILGGDNGHLNLDKKKNFLKIRVIRETKFAGYTRINLSCANVKNTLNGNGICKAFVGKNNMGKFLVVTCNDNAVIAY